MRSSLDGLSPKPFTSKRTQRKPWAASRRQRSWARPLVRRYPPHPKNRRPRDKRKQEPRNQRLQRRLLPRDPPAKQKPRRMLLGKRMADRQRRKHGSPQRRRRAKENNAGERGWRPGRAFSGGLTSPPGIECPHTCQRIRDSYISTSTRITAFSTALAKSSRLPKRRPGAGCPRSR